MTHNTYHLLNHLSSRMNFGKSTKLKKTKPSLGRAEYLFRNLLGKNTSSSDVQTDTLTRRHHSLSYLSQNFSPLNALTTLYYLTGCNQWNNNTLILCVLQLEF